MAFEVNNDLDQIDFNWHNKFHFFVSMAMAAITSFITHNIMVQHANPTLAAFVAFLVGYSVAFNIWVHWEIGDGFKPWWQQGIGKPWIIQQLFYADKFSLQDFLRWDLFGSLSGSIIGTVAAITYSLIG